MNYDFRKELCTVHQKGRRDPLACKKEGELELSDGAVVQISQGAGRILNQSARDFVDYLGTSMGISARLVQKETLDFEAENTVVFCTKEQYDVEGGLKSGGFSLIADHRVIVCGADEKGAAQGGYYLEDWMNSRKGPFIPVQRLKKEPLFSPRMTHSGYGLDWYPDTHLSAIAHAGMDAILVFTKGVDETPWGYLDFNDLIYRAGAYGIDVYAYSYFQSDLHPDDPGAFDFYDGQYGALFRYCPGLKGVVLVGESVGFRSKDPKTNGMLLEEKRSQIIPPDLPCPGWWPCTDFPQWLELLQKVIYKENDKADIVFWTYNWGYAPEQERVDLIEHLPAGISLLVTFEMFEVFQQGSNQVQCTDYTLAFPGPGRYFLSEAQAAKRRGIRLYTMSNTGGLTWDIGTIGYEPFPYQWEKRYQGLLDAQREYGLCGLMESHHFGFYPSFISEFAKQRFLSGGRDANEILGALAARDFGRKNQDAVLAAWQKWSDAIALCPPTVEDQYGPMRIGPSYPLALKEYPKLKTAPHAMFGSQICNTMYQPADNGRFLPLSLRLDNEITCVEQAVSLLEEGISILEPLAGTDEAKKQVNLGKFIACCFVTARNVKKWYQYKCKLWCAQEQAVMHEIAAQMRRIAEAEIQNAKRAIPLVEADSRLGWEPSMEYLCDREHLEIKIKQVEVMLKKELAIYEKEYE